MSEVCCENNFNKTDHQEEKEDILDEFSKLSLNTKNLTHPLENTWALWFFDNRKVESWSENLSLIGHFNTVEEFWRVYYNVTSVSDTKFGQGFGLFKKDILPMWEDKNNMKGGRWILHIKKSPNNQDLDVFWLETILCLIGQEFGDLCKDICGATITNRHKIDKLCLWTKNAKNTGVVLKIGDILKKIFGLDESLCIYYNSHEQTMNHQPIISYST